jgi:hypothetical protein
MGTGAGSDGSGPIASRFVLALKEDGGEIRPLVDDDDERLPVSSFRPYRRDAVLAVDDLEAELAQVVECHVARRRRTRKLRDERSTGIECRQRDRPGAPVIFHVSSVRSGASAKAWSGGPAM